MFAFICNRKTYQVLKAHSLRRRNSTRGKKGLKYPGDIEERHPLQLNCITMRYFCVAGFFTTYSPCKPLGLKKQHGHCVCLISPVRNTIILLGTHRRARNNAVCTLNSQNVNPSAIRISNDSQPTAHSICPLNSETTAPGTLVVVCLSRIVL